MAEYDEQCHWCGQVLTGPNKGQIEAPGGDAGHSYTHRTCPDCAVKMGRMSDPKRRGLRIPETQAERTMPGTTRAQRDRRRYATWDELMNDIRKK